MRDYDAIVIGTGQAGPSLAARAGSEGLVLQSLKPLEPAG